MSEGDSVLGRAQLLAAPSPKPGRGQSTGVQTNLAIVASPPHPRQAASFLLSPVGNSPPEIGSEKDNHPGKTRDPTKQCLEPHPRAGHLHRLSSITQQSWDAAGGNELSTRVSLWAASDCSPRRDHRAHLTDLTLYTHKDTDIQGGVTRLVNQGEGRAEPGPSDSWSPALHPLQVPPWQ